MWVNDFLKKNIFEPAGMFNTDLENGNFKYDNKASLYIKMGIRYIKSPKTQLSVKYAGGGIQSTAEDLLKFGEAILKHTLIDSTTFQQMITQKNSLKKGTPYGYGWFIIVDDKKGRILQHGGSQSGASSFLQIYLDKEIVVATIANNFNSDDEVYLLSKDLANLYMDPDAAKRSLHQYSANSNISLKGFTGRYVSGEEVLSNTKSGDFLKIEHDPYLSSLVYPSYANTFFYRYFDGKLIFNDKGLTYNYNGTLRNYIQQKD